ncbi:MAG TPA: glycosyltransferase family 1 protein [Bacteroidota bacterium]|nr:glycosyltransferase family 1 protein [Bacteroidota bacterium]
MKVLIDEGLSTLQQLGGIGYFSLNLYEHLKPLVDCEITNYRYLKGLPRVGKRAAYLVLANLEPLRRKYNVIHYQNYYIPIFPGRAKSVVTIHDLGGIRSPEVYPSWYNAYFRRTLRDAVRRANAITLASYAMKSELLDVFPNIDEDSVHVCHHGIRSPFFLWGATDADRVPAGLKPGSYFLFVGNLEKRKNLTFLLSQFIAARRGSKIARDTMMVLVGKLGVGYDEFRSLISESENIIYLGRLGEQELIGLYRNCKAFIFPSYYEGFGVPILEAMSQKVPILISNIPSSLEFHRRHNEQCFVFELGNAESLVEQLAHLDTHAQDIAPYLTYGDLTIYSYENVAREHLKVYRSVLQ